MFCQRKLAKKVCFYIIINLLHDAQLITIFSNHLIKMTRVYHASLHLQISDNVITGVIRDTLGHNTVSCYHYLASILFCADTGESAQWYKKNLRVMPKRY